MEVNISVVWQRSVVTSQGKSRRNVASKIRAMQEKVGTWKSEELMARKIQQSKESRTVVKTEESATSDDE